MVLGGPLVGDAVVEEEIAGVLSRQAQAGAVRALQSRAALRVEDMMTKAANELKYAVERQLSPAADSITMDQSATAGGAACPLS